jgi:hypothetical protein
MRKQATFVVGACTGTKPELEKRYMVAVTTFKCVRR